MTFDRSRHICAQFSCPFNERLSFAERYENANTLLTGPLPTNISPEKAGSDRIGFNRSNSMHLPSS
jgi:hypothetical protein